MIQVDQYFSKGLKPPTSFDCVYTYRFHQKNPLKFAKNILFYITPREVSKTNTEPKKSPNWKGMSSSKAPLFGSIVDFPGWMMCILHLHGFFRSEKVFMQRIAVWRCVVWWVKKLTLCRWQNHRWYRCLPPISLHWIEAGNICYIYSKVVNYVKTYLYRHWFLDFIMKRLNILATWN